MGHQESIATVYYSHGLEDGMCHRIIEPLMLQLEQGGDRVKGGSGVPSRGRVGEDKRVEKVLREGWERNVGGAGIIVVQRTESRRCSNETREERSSRPQKQIVLVNCKEENLLVQYNTFLPLSGACTC